MVEEELVEEQEHARSRLFDFVTNKGENKQIIHFNSFAGSGKSFTLRKLVKSLNLQGKQGVMMAYTGRASAHLAKSGLPASTCHSILYQPVLDGEGNLIEFEKKDLDEIRETCGDFIIVDESSMLPKEIHDVLISTKLPIIYAGDTCQLPSVSKDSFCVFDDDTKETLSLTINHRTDPSLKGIVDLSSYLRETNSIPRRKGEGLTLVPKAKTFNRSFFDDNYFDIVLCGMNKTRKLLNERIRQSMGVDDFLPGVGEIVVCLQNTIIKGEKIYNGERFEVLTIAGTMLGKNLHLYQLKSLDFYDKTVFVHIADETWETEKTPRGMNYRQIPPFAYGYSLSVHKCVHPETIVSTKEGMMPIRMISSTGYISGIDDIKEYKNKVVNPVLPSKKIVCENGYSITVTNDHKVEYFDPNSGSWIKKTANEVSIGDWFRLSLQNICDVDEYATITYPTVVDDVRGKQYKYSTIVDEKYGEFLGLMVADGCKTQRGFRLAKKSVEVCDRFASLVSYLFDYDILVNHTKTVNGTPFYIAEVHSATIARRLFGAIPELQPFNKSVPEVIMRSPLSVQKAFLRGLFEDGTVNIKNGKADHIEFFSEHESIVDFAVQVLLRCGIITTKAQYQNNGVSLYIYSEGMAKFNEYIGFISHHKKNRLELAQSRQLRYRVPISIQTAKDLYGTGQISAHIYQSAVKNGYVSRETFRKLGNFEVLNWHYVRVKTIENCMEPSMCVEVPDGNVFIQNGFPHSNSQGSSFDSVLFVDEDVSFFLDQQKFRYTAITRAAQELTVGL